MRVVPAFLLAVGLVMVAETARAHDDYEINRFDMKLPITWNDNEYRSPKVTTFYSDCSSAGPCDERDIDLVDPLFDINGSSGRGDDPQYAIL